MAKLLIPPFQDWNLQEKFFSSAICLSMQNIIPPYAPDADFPQAIATIKAWLTNV